MPVLLFIIWRLDRREAMKRAQRRTQLWRKGRHPWRQHTAHIDRRAETQTGVSLRNGTGDVTFYATPTVSGHSDSPSGSAGIESVADGAVALVLLEESTPLLVNYC